MAIVFTIPMHPIVQTQSIAGSLHQIFPAGLNSSPRVSSCVLIAPHANGETSHHALLGGGLTTTLRIFGQSERIDRTNRGHTVDTACAGARLAGAEDNVNDRH